MRSAVPAPASLRPADPTSDARQGSPARAEAREELFFPFGDGGCFGCSKTNPDGLHLRFFREDDEVAGECTVPEKFHGAPGIVHGGIVATILDEFSCAAAVALAGSRVVTGELQVRYERPCPVERSLTVRSRIVSTDHPRYVVIDAEILLDGTRVVRSTGKFFRQPAS